MERKKRIRIILGFGMLAVLVVITAAAVKSSIRINGVPAENGEKETEGDGLRDSESAGQLSHLYGYETMESDNERGRFGSFYLSEQTLDGKGVSGNRSANPVNRWTAQRPHLLSAAKTASDTLYYQLSDEEKDIIILINGEQSEAEVFYKGKSERFPITGFYTNLGSEGGSFQAADLTGDGTDELLYIGYGGGTGVHEETYCILNLETMKRYEIEDFTKVLIRRISAEVVGEDENGFPTAKITDTEGTVRYGKMRGIVSDESVNYTFNPEQDCRCFYLEVEPKGPGLKVTVCFTLEPNYGTYLGEITGYMKFDSRSETFLLTEDCEIELYDPIDWNE